MIENLQQCINEIIAALQKLKSSLNNEPVNIKQTAKVIQGDDSFQELTALLFSEKWPEAVNPELICNHNIPDEAIARGNGIFDLMVEEQVENIKFLDFGCGEGWSVRCAAQRGADFAVGYDIKPSENWNNPQEKVQLTTNWDEVVQNGPYDVILCFDVLDHSKEEPVNCLKKMNSVLKENGNIYIRSHPYMSRHAHHFYNTINKAFIHLVFTEEELKQINDQWGVENNNWSYTRKITTPLAIYQRWLQESGLKAIHNREIKEEVENFFKETPSLANRIKKHTQFDTFPEFQTSLSFVDAVLKKA